MKIAIMDLDSIAFAIGHPNKVLSSDGNPLRENNKFVYVDKTEEELKSSADFWMNKILEDSKSTGYIAFIKGEGNFRYQINSDYKSNRPKESPHWWTTVKNYLIEKWNAIPVNFIEVDDAVNLTRLNLSSQGAFTCAIDKDLISLKSENPHYNWRKEEWVTVTEKEAITKFWIDMIAGQTGDAIKGIPGKGIKFATKLFDLNVNTPLSIVTLRMYIDYFGEKKGIEEYYKNYTSLKILDNIEDVPKQSNFHLNFPIIPYNPSKLIILN